MSGPPAERSGPATTQGPPADHPDVRTVTRRRRIARELDRLLGVDRAEVDITAVNYWHVTYMDQGWIDRDHAGRALLEAA